MCGAPQGELGFGARALVLLRTLGMASLIAPTRRTGHGLSVHVLIAHESSDNFWNATTGGVSRILSRW